MKYSIFLVLVLSALSGCAPIEQAMKVGGSAANLGSTVVKTAGKVVETAGEVAGRTVQTTGKMVHTVATTPILRKAVLKQLPL